MADIARSLRSLRACEKKKVSKEVKHRDDVHPWRLTACVGANTMVATVTHTVDRNPRRLCPGFLFYLPDTRLTAPESQQEPSEASETPLCYIYKNPEASLDARGFSI